MQRLAALAARCLGAADGDGLQVLVQAIRAAMIVVSCSLLEGLLAADTGHRGPRVDCGAVEAGCKAVIGQRLKLSGTRCSTRGATAITTLRWQHASSLWHEI